MNLEKEKEKFLDFVNHDRKRFFLIVISFWTFIVLFSIVKVYISHSNKESTFKTIINKYPQIQTETDFSIKDQLEDALDLFLLKSELEGLTHDDSLKLIEIENKLLKLETHD